MVAVAKRITLLLAAFLCVAACCPKPDPGTDIDPVPTPQPQPQPGPGPEPGPEPKPEPKDKDVTLMEAFTEDFSAREPEFFSFAVYPSRDDFRYYSGFPSMSESGNTVLMLRLDLEDSAREGAVASSLDYTYYGSYSIRMRIPDVSAVQPKLDARVEFALFDDDEVFGRDEISFALRLDAPASVDLSLSRTSPDGKDTLEERETVTPGVSGFNASAKNYIYGIDWSEDRIVWWIKTRVNSDKTVLKEVTADVPAQPLRLMLRYYRDTKAANYPYEMEADWINYTPSQQ